MAKESKKNKKNKKNKKTRRQRVKSRLLSSSINQSISGQPVASGGFGCVFKPPLRCMKYPLLEKYNKTFVSKMMMDKYAKEEMDIIKEFRPHITKIKNYNDYFIIDNIYSCQPKQLHRKSLKNFEKVCSAFTNYTKNTINENIDDFELINSPDGGIDLEKFWRGLGKSNQNSSSLFAVTNICMINLLNKGIKEMNRKKIFHLDLKGSNILHSKKNNKLDSIDGIKVRIIDWGLAIYKPNKLSFPEKLFNRPFQFNMPFSNILIQKDIKFVIREIVTSYSKNNNVKIKTINKLVFCKFLANEIYNFSLYRLGDGHIEYIKETIKLIQSHLYKKNTYSYLIKNTPQNIITSYLAVILETYTNSYYEFDINTYVNDVYLKNVDVWGFVMSYIDIITTSNNPRLVNNLIKIIFHYLFTTKYAVVPIPIEMLTKDLENLNNAVKQPLKIGTYTILS